MKTIFIIIFLLQHYFSISQGCTNQTTISCNLIDSTMRVILVYGIVPQTNCSLVIIGNDKFIFDPIMINVVWITLPNTDNACITNIAARAQTVFSLLQYPSSMEIVLLNVTAQYYRMVLVTRGCSGNCTVNPFTSDLESRLRNASLSLYPIFNDLNQFGPYCLYGGTIDTTYLGAGYRCNCLTISSFMGPSCELLEIDFSNTIAYFNIFKSATTINLRFSFFSNGIMGSISILTIKNNLYQRMVEIIISESSIVLKTQDTTSSAISITVDNVNWHDISVVLSQTNATLTINYLSTVIAFTGTSAMDFRSFYLLINEPNANKYEISLKNMIANSKLIDFYNPTYLSACTLRCYCALNQDCDCRPFVSKGNTVCNCKPGYILSGTTCSSNNIPMAQMTDSVTAIFSTNNVLLTKVDFGFQTLSTSGSLLTVTLSNPLINFTIKIVNTNLTLNLPNQRVRTINYNVSNGQIHNVTLTIKPYSIQMLLDNNINYTTNLINWFTSSTFPISTSVINAVSITIGPMQRSFYSVINQLTTCFSVIRLNSIGTPLDVFPSLSSTLSPQCTSGPRCSSGAITCATNQVCMDTEWQNTKCICIANFTSINLVCMYNQCITNPCQNNGTCAYNAGINSYSCSCTSSFTGNNCQITAASLWWIAILILLLVVLIVLIILLIYFCCYQNNSPTLPHIAKIHENVGMYNEQAGESDYNGPPLNFATMNAAINNKGKNMKNQPSNTLPNLMKNKETFDKNNGDIILDHPLEYGYEGYDSDNGSISTIGSMSINSQVDNPVTDNTFKDMDHLYKKT